MSDGYYKDTVLLVDKKMEFNRPQDVELATRVGVASSLHHTLQSTTAPTDGSAGQVKFNRNFSNGNVDSTPRVRFSGNATIDNLSNAIGDATSLVNLIGLKSYALNSHFSNMESTLNGSKITSKPHQMVECHKKSCDLGKAVLITDTPAVPILNSYAAANLNNTLREGADTIGSNSSNGFGNHYTVTSLNVQAGTVADSKKVTFSFVIEAVPMGSPFQFNENNPVPLRNLDNFELDISVKQIGTDFFALDASLLKAGTQPVISVTGVKWELLVHEFTSALPIDIPDKIVWDNKEVKLLKSQAFTPAGGGDVFTSESFILDSVPNALYIIPEVTRPDDSAKLTLPKYYSGIQKFELNVGTLSNIFQNLTEKQLYEMYLKNGGNQRYSSWAGTQMGFGAPLFGNGGLMIVRPDDVPKADQVNFMTHSNEKYTCNFTMQLSSAEPMTVNVYAVYDQLVLYNKDDMNGYSFSRPKVSGKDLSMSSVLFTNDTSRMNQIVGGFSLGDLFTGAKNVITHPFTRQGVKWLRNNAPGVKHYARDHTHWGRLFNSFGYGQMQGGELLRIGQGNTGGATKTSTKTKKSKTKGGRATSDRDLQRELDNM